MMLMTAATAFAQPAEVNRILRTIDFEERSLGNAEDLPMHWAKIAGTNFPHYINGKLTTDRHRGGKYSFRLDLNGGSLAYRYDPGQIRVITGAHYRVEAWVQTTILAHARARLSAYFTDLDGHPLTETIHHSELYAAKGGDHQWQRLSVELTPQSPEAAYLVLEIGLLQPQQWEHSTLGQRTLYEQDIYGSAWFDDITVSQVPQVTLSTDRPGNIFRRSDPLRLQVLVNDRFIDDLSAQLLITDSSGNSVYQRSGALDMSTAQTLGPGQKRMSLLLPDLQPGWYEATLVMSSQGQLVGEQTLDLVRLADEAPFSVPDERFGIIATDLPIEGWAELPKILPYLGTGRVKLAVWSKQGDIQQSDSAAFDELLEQLSSLGITPTACLVDLPPSIAGRVGGNDWTNLLTASKDLWQPQLAFLLARHANHLERWQLGEDGTDAFVNDPKMRDVYALVYNEFAQLIQSPDLAMPWPAWFELEGQLPATVALSVPPSVLPSQLPLYMQDLKGHEGHNLSISLQLLDRTQYGREMQIRDLAQRVIYALAADARRIDLPLPFTVRRENEQVIRQPKELLMVMRTLITTLGGTQYHGKLPLAEGVEAFLFEKNGQGILALWDRGNEPTVRNLAINFGKHPYALDLWGNITPLARPTEDARESTVAVTVGPTPIFLMDVDAQLAQLRASIALDRPLIESSFQPHTRHIRFINPYRQAIGGTFKLKAPPGWTVSPPTNVFTLNPGETFDREITIEFPYNSFAGPKVIEAEFLVQADRNSSFTAPIVLNLGLSDVGMQSLAVRDGDDVLIQQIISNYGDKPIDYISFAIFPGQARQERLVTNLGPGRTTIKRYKFTNVKITKDSTVRVGVKELEGTRILNEEVPVQ
ncbi:MAG: hypothetical protein IT447_15090 [Phycisphaerales bacterium]|nr:hypothetical protein [Phycisphaerales bacterium]